MKHKYINFEICIHYIKISLFKQLKEKMNFSYFPQCSSEYIKPTSTWFILLDTPNTWLPHSLHTDKRLFRKREPFQLLSQVHTYHLSNKVSYLRYSYISGVIMMTVMSFTLWGD